MEKFIALDVETANEDFSSICQVGLATFENGSMVDGWVSLVNPRCYFDPFNVEIHGVTEEMVKDSPKIPEIFSILRPRLSGQTVVHHMPFDRIAFSRAADKYDIENIDCRWLDSARVSRRVWEECRNSGYGLKDISNRLGITFQHHDALEDARAAGEIMLKAFSITNHSLDQMVEYSLRRIRGDSSRYSLDGNPEGVLYGEKVVFTGTLSMTREEAAKLAAAAGCSVTPKVNLETTILVVGVQDLIRTHGSEKSTKHKYTESLIAKGHPIKVINENDFLFMVKHPLAM